NRLVRGQDIFPERSRQASQPNALLAKMVRQVRQVNRVGGPGGPSGDLTLAVEVRLLKVLQMWNLRFFPRPGPRSRASGNGPPRLADLGGPSCWSHHFTIWERCCFLCLCHSVSTTLCHNYRCSKKRGAFPCPTPPPSAASVLRSPTCASSSPRPTRRSPATA